MNDLKVYDTLVQKRTEGVQTYRFGCIQDGKPAIPNPDYHYKACFATQDSLARTVDMTIEDGLVHFDSNQIIDLPAGVYRLEVWEMASDVIHAIFPSDRQLKFTVKFNTYDLPNRKVSSLTLDEFEKRFKKLAGQAATGTFQSPKFKVGKTTTLSSEQPATVEMITNDDGTVTVNYGIPKGETWVPYVNEKDGKWHIRLKEDK